MRKILLVLLLAACGKSDGGPTGDVLAAWQKAGLTPGAFEPVPGKSGCRSGKVNGIDAIVCEYPDVGEAKRAEGVALAGIKDATGLALAEGKVLVVLADRGGADPSGKKMNELARSFRNR